jgi:hypothetical protein
MRYDLVLAAAAGCFGSTASAEDLCAALRATTADVILAREAANRASSSVLDLRSRLGEAPRLYAEEVMALSDPRSDTYAVWMQLRDVVTDLESLMASRCPDIPARD